jgi:hypothetical protein
LEFDDREAVTLDSLPSQKIPIRKAALNTPFSVKLGKRSWIHQLAFTCS